MAGGHATGQPRRWLRAEGLLTLCVAIALYGRSDASWMLFGLLFLAPDLSFLGYVAGPRFGAVLYNVLHSHVGPLATSLIFLLLHEPVTIPLIWFAHIGFDRALGYGLKYPTAFQDTHLGMIGKQGRDPDIAATAAEHENAAPPVRRGTGRVDH